jgi:hypothetical protein
MEDILWNFLMNRRLQLGSVVVRKKDLPSTAVDADLVILNLETNNYIGLDNIGRRIWELLDTPSPAAQIATTMCAQFSGPPEVIERDVLALLQEMAEEGLIDVSHG